MDFKIVCKRTQKYLTQLFIAMDFKNTGQKSGRHILFRIIQTIFKQYIHTCECLPIGSLFKGVPSQIPSHIQTTT